MASKGERNNNPGNLEASPWTRGQPGYVGSDGRFAIFDTMANGIAAQTRLLYEKYILKGFDTVEKIIWRYGNDPGTADDNSVRNYVKYVARRLGIGVNDTINASQLPALGQAMREFETGKTFKGTIGPSIGSAADIIQWAKDVMSGKSKGQSWGEWIAQKDKEMGIPSPEELGAGARDAIEESSPIAFLKSLFSGEMAGRFSAVIIGIILVGLAIAAFVFLSETKTVQSVAAKVG